MYRYKIVKLPRDLEARERLINELGAHGWELVQVEGNVGYFFRPVFPFKPEMETKSETNVSEEPSVLAAAIERAMINRSRDRRK